MQQTTTRNELQEPTDASLKSYWQGKRGSVETKQKISETLKGRKLTDEHKKNMFHFGMKGKHHSEKTKEKIRIGHIGLNVWNKGTKGIMKPNKTSFKKGNINWNTGKSLTDEHKLKLSQSHIGQISTKKGKSFDKFYGYIKSNDIKKKISLTLRRKFKDKELESPFIELRKQNRLILPKKDTLIEVKIQNFLKQLNIDFLTHQYIKEIEHGYQCDILIPSMKMVIECDGDYWHKYPIGNDIDHIRTSELLQKGFKVLRLWEYEIKLMDINKFQEKLNDK